MKIVPPEDGNLKMVVYGVYHEDEGPDAIRYVGKTEGKFSERVSSHRTEAGAPSFAHSRRPVLMFHRKYGEKSTFRILGTANTPEQLSELEVAMIEKYNTFHSARGLNCTIGGEGTSGFVSPKGGDHHSSALTNDEARDIYELVATGEFTQREIAKAYNVSFQVVTNIIQGNAYKNLNLVPMGDRRPLKSKWISGADNFNAKLDDASARDIHFRYASGESAAALGDEFGVDRNTIIRVINGTGWRHLKLPNIVRDPSDPPPQHGEANRGAKMTEAQVFQAYALIKSGTPAASVAEKFGVSYSAIRRIATGRSWGHLGLEPLP